ncbi:MAG: hypothetical protein GX594_10365 [Pirellulaceae bacterium]|nr:hypothetical protein [Pirellulaceae bacterium]
MSALDFRRKPESSANTAGRTRRWIIGLTLLLGVTVVIADRAREPGAWRWLDLLSDAADEPPGVGVDNRLRPGEQDEDSLDRFIIKMPEAAEDPEVAQRRGYFPGVNSDLFHSVRDKTLFSSDDHASSYNLLDVLNRTAERQLRAAAAKDVTYAQLFRQPRYYRGRLVTVSGRVAGVRRMQLPSNQYGLTHYFEVVLYPNVRPLSPILLYSLNLPEGFPTGEGLSEKAEAAGFFFKNGVYRSGDGFRIAPTVLTKTLRWEKPPPPAEKPAIEGRMILLGIVIAALLAMVTAWYVYRQTKPTAAPLPEQSPNFDMLKEMDLGNETVEDR